MLTLSCPDVSPDFEDTWAFLDRSLRGVTEAGKAMNEISLARALCRAAGVLRLSHIFRLQAAATALRGVTKRFDNEEPSTSTPSASEERTKSEDKA